MEHPAYDKVAVEKRSDLIALVFLCISSSSPRKDYILRASSILKTAGCEVDAKEYLGGVYDTVLGVFRSSASADIKAEAAAMKDRLENINDKISNLEQSRSDQHRRFTKKNLIAPFTKSRADSAHGGTYVPRDDLLEKLKASFAEQIGGKRVVLLTGMGGCGKSELARAYAEEHRDEYDEIFWLTYGMERKTSPKLMELFDACFNKVDKTEIKEADVECFTSRTLIIVDNCDRDDLTLLNELEKSTGKADILITTRRSALGSFENIVPVESDDPSAFSYSVFENYYCRKPQHGCAKQIKNEESSSVYQICELVQNNTMVVAMIAIRLREYNSLTISDCAEKMVNGIRNIKGKIKVRKDQNHHTGEILNILEFLFEDILRFDFSDVQKAILTLLSLTPAEWYEMDYLFALAGGVKADDYRFESSELLIIGFLQGNDEQIAIHPIVAELILDKTDIVIKESSFYEEILVNFLGLKEEYLFSHKNFIGKILHKSSNAQSSVTIPTMLLLNHGDYKTVFLREYPYVNVAYFVRVDLKDKRIFKFRDLKKEQTITLKEVPLNEPSNKKAILLKVFSSDAMYTLDLRQSFYNLMITEIPAGICYNDKRIKKLLLSDKCVSIGEFAFSNCSGLTSELHLPDGLTSIGNGAFAHCSGLTGGLHLPDGLISIGNDAFAYCSGLTGELHLPDGLARIGDSAFSGCSGLTGELHLPDALTSIGAFAFSGCSRLSGELHLPDALTSIGGFAFEGCSGLTGELHFPDGLASIGAFAFLFCAEITQLFIHNPEVVLPESIFDPYSSVVICGHKGSTAEKYAKEHNLNFEELT